MLENVGIVGTNSIQDGKATRQFLMQIVTPKLVHMIDLFTLSKTSEDDTTTGLQTKEKMDMIVDSPRKCDSAAHSGKTLQDDSQLKTWSLVFLLRLYITTKSLNRECISLMPPKAAKKAREALDGPATDYVKGDITNILTRFGAASFLSGVGKGTVKVSHFLAGIERKQDSEELVNCPPLSYSLDCFALQSLAQLSRHIEAVTFLVMRFKVGNVVSNGSIKTKDPGLESTEVDSEDFSAAKAQSGVQKKLQKLLKDLKKESQYLAKFLLREVGWQENIHDAKLTSGTSNCLSHIFFAEGESKVGLLADISSQHLPKQNWDLVEATLTVDTLPLQRWNLVCKSFDIWAKFAAEEDLRKFVVFLFSSSQFVPPTITASEEQNKKSETMSQEDYRKQITDDLLCNALFYEEESFRRVFPSTFVEELKKLSLSAFGTWPFESHALNSFRVAEVLSHIGQGWSDFTMEIEAAIGARGQEQAPSSASKMKCRETYGFSSQASENRDHQLQGTTPLKADQLTSISLAAKRQRPRSVNGKAPSKQSKNRWSHSRLNALHHCVELVRHLSAIPSGYIESNECANCAYTLLCFERLLTSSLLEFSATALGSSRAAVQNVEISTVFKLLQALSACRSALLALTSADALNVSNSMLMAVLAVSFSSSRWLPLSIQAATISLVDSLECSNLPKQERKHMMSLGKSLLYEVLKTTATIVTLFTEEILSIEVKKSSNQDNGPMTVTTKVVGPNAERIFATMESPAGGKSLIDLIDYHVEMIDHLIINSIDEEVNFAQHQGDDCDDTSGMKAHFEGLTLSSSLSSYFWSLRDFSEKLSKDQNRPLALLTPSLCHAQKVGLYLTGTLVRALVPAGSHAVLLLGEHEVDRTYDSGEKKFKITVVNQAHQEDNQVVTMEDEADGEEDVEEPDPTTVVPAVEESGDEEDEQKDTEEMDLDGQKDYSLHLETHDDIHKGEVGKHDSETEATEMLYTAKSNLQRSLLENLLRSNCNNCDIIGELYLATAGILKLESIHLSDSKTALGSASSPDKGSQFQEGLPSSVNLLMGAGYWLLMKAAEDSQRGHSSHLGWLIGVVKYMDAVCCLTPYLKSPLPPLAFSKLFNMHVHLLGSLTPSEEQFHSLKLPHPLDAEGQKGISNGQATDGHGSHNKDAKASSPHSLRIAVRESLGTLLRTASRYHSVLALQSIMRALVGVSDSNHSYGLGIGRAEDGKVGREVAAGIECLSIALETVSGTKRLRLLANHFQEFFGAIFNIMEYLQGPNLFLVAGPPFSQVDSIEAETRITLAGSKVDSGPVILQALQILITTASRDVIFPMKACHVALALHCPARLFCPVYRSVLSKKMFMQKQHSAAEIPGPGMLKIVHVTGVVRIGTELGVKLYVSCCRLLCSIIRHHRRESGHCIALLGDSARVLLHCLEAPNWPSSDEDGAKNWSIRMSAYCASWLRRVYEEMGEHKETLGKYCSHFLSDYLSVISGHGPHAAGLIREVEAALQPGTYVLVDACSANDLQQLHTALGEGPRRNALLNLRQRYQHQFQYKGKV